MDEIVKEYGGIFLGISGTLLILGIAAKLIVEGGILGELIMKLGNMAC